MCFCIVRSHDNKWRPAPIFITYVRVKHRQKTESEFLQRDLIVAVRVLCTLPYGGQREWWGELPRRPCVQRVISCSWLRLHCHLYQATMSSLKRGHIQVYAEIVREQPELKRCCSLLAKSNKRKSKDTQFTLLWTYISLLCCASTCIVFYEPLIVYRVMKCFVFEYLCR